VKRETDHGSLPRLRFTQHRRRLFCIRLSTTHYRGYNSYHNRKLSLRCTCKFVILYNVDVVSCTDPYHRAQGTRQHTSESVTENVYWFTIHTCFAVIATEQRQAHCVKFSHPMIQTKSLDLGCGVSGVDGCDRSDSACDFRISLIFISGFLHVYQVPWALIRIF
jgi:hypothetical protein